MLSPDITAAAQAHVAGDWAGSIPESLCELRGDPVSGVSLARLALEVERVQRVVLGGGRLAGALLCRRCVLVLQIGLSSRGTCQGCVPSG